MKLVNIDRDFLVETEEIFAEFGNGDISGCKFGDLCVKHFMDELYEIYRVDPSRFEQLTDVAFGGDTL